MIQLEIDVVLDWVLLGAIIANVASIYLNMRAKQRWDAAADKHEAKLRQILDEGEEGC